MRLYTTEELPSIAACRQVDPQKLSGLVRGELDWIVMKALEKDRNRRYETANSLAADLRRYLDDEPVMACPPSAWYRFRKFARRNRAALATASVVAASLVTVAVLSVLYADRQRRFGIEKEDAARKITTLAGDLTTSLAESNRLLATRNFDRGQAAFEKGEIGPGMLWMIESWQAAIAAGDPAWQHAARANLAAWQPHYPRLKAVLSHASPVVAAAFSPDSRTVISGSTNGTAQLWDAASGKSIGLPLRQGGEWLKVRFSPDGKTALTFSEGDTVRLWDATTGEPLGLVRLQPQAHILAAAIQSEGKIVLVGTEANADNVVRLWDPATGQPIGPALAHLSHVFPPVPSPDGRIILTPSQDGTARLWDAATGQPIGQPLKRSGGFWSAAFSPDGKTILTGGRDGAALLWNTATGQPIGLPMRHENIVMALAFSPDGKTLLTGGMNNEARLWDAATGQLIGLLDHQSSVHAVAFSPDGKTILTASQDRTARLWDAGSGQPEGLVLDIPSTDAFGPDSDMSPDGKLLTSIPREPTPRYIQLWNATTRQPIARLPHPGGTRGARFSLDSKVLLTITADQTARLWDATTGAGLGVPFPLPCPLLPEGYPVGLCPDGKTFWFVGNDQRVWICDGATGSVRGRTPAVGGIPYGVDFSPDGKTFLTGLDSGEVRLWDAATLTPLGDQIPIPGAIVRGRFSPDGKSIAVTCEEGTGWLYDLQTRKPLIPPLRGHQASVYGLAFSPDGRTLVTGSKDKTARLWDIATGQPIGPALRHPSNVGVAFFADSKTLFTQSTVRRRFPIPPDLPDELERVAAWVQVITGLRLDKQRGLIQVLDNAAWLERRQQLMELGGPPETGPEQRLDSILFGLDPTARARSLIERKQWDAAEVAFYEAMRARPFNIGIMMERGDLYAKRGLWKEAAAYYATKVKQYPDVAPLHEQLAVTRLLAGDGPGYRAACREMLGRFKPIDDSTAAVCVAYACSLAGEAVSDLPGLIQVSERSTRWVASNERDVGAVLFRAGRLGEALMHFEQVHKVFQPRAWDWLFLAMIHSRLGHTSEGCRCLKEADQWITEADKAPLGTENEGPRWSNLTERLTTLFLRREAEAVVRFDPGFPAEPFAPH
jgi:WD40 repeat protein/tetratricopeptide (TPR) repeat protein